MINPKHDPDDDEATFDESSFNSHSLFGSDDDSQALQSALDEAPSELEPLDCNRDDVVGCHDRDHEYRVLAGRVRTWRGEVEDRAAKRAQASSSPRTVHRSPLEARQGTSSGACRSRGEKSSDQRISVKVKAKNFDTLLEKFHLLFNKEIDRLKAFRRKKPVRFSDG